MALSYVEKKVSDCSVSPNLSNLKGKTAIVTGGSSGLGAAYVKAFSDAGAYTTIADIQENKELTALPNVQFTKCDVRVWSEQLSVFKAALAHSPNKRIDIVVANAGIAGNDPIMALDDTDDPTEPDLRIANINLIGVLYTTKLALHYFNKSPLPAEEKCLILKSSLAGYIAIPSAPSYQCSKYAVRGLMCNLRRSGRCRVNLVAPWFINTPIMTEAVISRLGPALQNKGSEFAEVDDSVKAVLRIACDSEINGRALAIVPRSMAKDGYVDLDVDDYEEGTLLHRLNEVSTNMNHRSMPPKEQEPVRG